MLRRGDGACRYPTAATTYYAVGGGGLMKIILNYSQLGFSWLWTFFVAYSCHYILPLKRGLMKILSAGSAVGVLPLYHRFLHILRLCDGWIGYLTAVPNYYSVVTGVG